MAVCTLMNKSVFTVASVPGSRHSAEKSNDQVTDVSFTFFSTNGTQSQKRSPLLSHTLILKSLYTVYGIILKSCTRKLCVPIAIQKCCDTRNTAFFFCLSEIIPSQPSCFRQFFLFIYVKNSFDINQHTTRSLTFYLNLFQIIDGTTK